MVLKLDVGSKAENFSLKDKEGKEKRLDTGDGNILLVFYTGGFDNNAMKLLGSLKDQFFKFKELNVRIIAVTPELQEKVKKTTGALQAPFDILSDPEMKVIRLYDVFDPIMNWTYPAAFIIDKDGIIQYAFRGVCSPNIPDVNYLIKKLIEMNRPEEAGLKAKHPKNASDIP